MRRNKSCRPILEPANFLISPFLFLIILFNKAVKTPSSSSDHAGETKFLVQYFGHTKKGKSLGL